ncbi:MAG: hypothetical protein JWO04_410 [Gammaproteobacteria bacterium]|nr:hypothetical protein [Gammaproteobacteria bacterium]
MSVRSVVVSGSLPSNTAADAWCDRGCRPPAAQDLFGAWAAGRKARLPPRQRKVSVVMSVYQEPVSHPSRSDRARLPWNANDFRALAYSLAGRGARRRRPSSRVRAGPSALMETPKATKWARISGAHPTTGSSASTTSCKTTNSKRPSFGNRVPHRARPAGRSHALPRRRRQDYNDSARRDRIAQSAFDWSMMKAADQENFDRRRSRENPRTLERLAICA